MTDKCIHDENLECKLREAPSPDNCAVCIPCRLAAIVRQLQAINFPKDFLLGVTAR